MLNIALQPKYEGFLYGNLDGIAEWEEFGVEWDGGLKKCLII